MARRRGKPGGGEGVRDEKGEGRSRSVPRDSVAHGRGLRRVLHVDDLFGSSSHYRGEVRRDRTCPDGSQRGGARTQPDTVGALRHCLAVSNNVSRGHMSTSKNLFCTVLTHAAPSSNYRGESEENRTIIQKITKGDHEYAVVSPEAMRNALRDILAARELPTNRTRLLDEEQLAVKFKDFPNAEIYADDFLFGYLVADSKEMKKKSKQPAKRDSILRMNMAVALSPYRFDATFHQSPLNAGSSPWKNSTTSALLH